ncbi:MAG: carbohydrate-binding domain-containing protein, partial [Anaerolineaceae bacterium]
MKKFIVGLTTLILIFTLTACSANSVGTNAALSNSAQSSEAAASEAEATVVGAGADSVVDAQAENSEIHADAGDYVWDEAAVVSIELNGDAISVTGEGVTVEGSQATITSAGTYRLSGSLTDGQIIVDTQDEDVVRLILNGVELHNSDSAAINVVNGKKVVLILADGTENTISDGETYVFENAEEDEPNAAIFSKGDLSIYGSGSLTVSGNYNDGIASKDGLVIASGTIKVSAVDDGIRGRDYIVVQDGNITVNSGGDGLKSDNEEDTAKGYIEIDNGVIRVTSGGDAIAAQTDVMITDGEFDLTAGAGSGVPVDATASTKGIKGVVNVNIDGGTFNLNTADDGIHSNGSITINNGTFQIASGDDGMHADATLEVNGGDIQVTKSYEGLESAVITINAGNISLVSSDDGINVAGGNDGSGAAQGGGNQPGGGGGGPRQDFFSTASGNYYLYIHGGRIVVDANGDGLDSNGSIEMTDGVVIVNGPTEQMNGALDAGTFTISGGFLVAVGSVGMAEAPSDTSSQYSVLVNLDSIQQVGSLVHIQNSAG